MRTDMQGRRASRTGYIAAALMAAAACCNAAPEGTPTDAAIAAPATAPAASAASGKASAASGPAPAASRAEVAPARPMTHAELVDSLLDPRGVLDAKISRDGKHVLVKVFLATGNSLGIVDTDTMAIRMLSWPHTKAGWVGTFEVRDVHWLSNQEFAVDYSDGDCFVMDVKGDRGAVIGDRLVHAVHEPGQPDDWAIVREAGIFSKLNYKRVNIHTGSATRIPLDLPGEVAGVLFDAHGRIRVATTRESSWRDPALKFSVWYRHDDSSTWQRLEQMSVGELDTGWWPLLVPDDSDTLVVSSRQGRDTAAVFHYDVASRRLDDLMVAHPTEDVAAGAADDRSELQRVVSRGMRSRTYWLDADWARVQAAVDAALPEARNVLSGDPKGRVLIFSYSDRNPGTWLVLDTTKMTMRQLGELKRGVEPKRMRPMETLRYKSTDGLEIPAYLTVPAGPARPHPLVVMIHGGPNVRDEWEFNDEVQLLAAAGYAVFQPQFRGSAGFGLAFEQAGYRQWGLAMQDDITAGVRDLVERHVADPARICIYGASYGGYAALWGLEKTPELYRCGVSFAGVTDIGEMFSDWSDTNRDDLSMQLRQFTIGDLKAMRGQFDAVSPEKHADRVRVPVFLAHGTDDERFPIGHSRRMARALTAAGKELRTHWFDDEGHGLLYLRDIRAFQIELLDFLEQNLGPGDSPAESTAKQ